MDITNSEGSTNKNEEKETETIFWKSAKEIGTDYSFKRKIVWFNAIGFLILHLLGLYGLYLMFCVKLATAVWAIAVGFFSGQGITMGAHRLFTHKSYKAKTVLKVFLIIMQTMAGQNCLYVWVRDHRQHHKYSDSDADPHNAHRGFFFSHIGWLMSKKHPLVIEKGKGIDMSDMEADPYVMFQKKYYKLLYVIFSIAIPVAVPVYFWNEDPFNALMTAYFFRYVVALNNTWFVNSWAHIFGTKPFDKYMLPRESHFVSVMSMGEGWHNYHHVFPFDYRTSELGASYNITGYLIDLCAYLGLAYDLRSTPYDIVKARALRTGDGSHSVFNKNHEGKSEEASNGDKEKSNAIKKEAMVEKSIVTEKRDNIRGRNVSALG